MSDTEAMANLTANDAQQVIIPLERDLDSMGWDQGFNAWLIHQHEGQDVELIKVIDRCMDEGPLAMVNAAPPPMGACHVGLVVQFECWLDAEHTRSIRYVLAGLRSGVMVVVTREQEAKPRCRIIPVDTMPNAHEDIVEIMLALRSKVTQPSNGPMDFLQQLFGGGASVIVVPINNPMFRGEPDSDATDS